MALGPRGSQLQGLCGGDGGGDGGSGGGSGRVLSLSSKFLFSLVRDAHHPSPSLSSKFLFSLVRDGHHPSPSLTIPQF